MHIEEKQLIDFILDSGLVSRSDIDAAKKEAEAGDMGLGKVLIKQGKITDDELRRMQAYVLGIPFVDLRARNLILKFFSYS
jgi:type IV pilus assembly protein PilB